eukprot:TRINITY_DN267_c7_g1_i1.p1 TRINITY_DN267_c7_g1~~TRINITY_DN267_c7_g1_i1.p1  ORF type:complete len:306 (+),score=44.95 TRINITY_DN267_c7_g1_i1:68-985(+)
MSGVDMSLDEIIQKSKVVPTPPQIHPIGGGRGLPMAGLPTGGNMQMNTPLWVPPAGRGNKLRGVPFQQNMGQNINIVSGPGGLQFQKNMLGGAGPGVLGLMGGAIIPQQAALPMDAMVPPPPPPPPSNEFLANNLLQTAGQVAATMSLMGNTPPGFDGLMQNISSISNNSNPEDVMGVANMVAQLADNTLNGGVGVGGGGGLPPTFIKVPGATRVEKVDPRAINLSGTGKKVRDDVATLVRSHNKATALAAARGIPLPTLAEQRKKIVREKQLQESAPMKGPTPSPKKPRILLKHRFDRLRGISS